MITRSAHGQSPIEVAVRIQNQKGHMSSRVIIRRDMSP